MMALPGNQDTATHPPKVRINYNGEFVAERDRDEQFVAKLQTKIGVWDVDPATGNLSLDFGRFSPVKDRIRYLYSWSGTGDATIVSVSENELQDPACEHKPPSKFHLGRMAEDDEQFEKSIVFLLESPHRDEVDRNLRPCGPANGSTGLNLNKRSQFVAEALKSLNVCGTNIPVIICNPVQYATSCRFPLSGKKYPQADWRNEVLVKMLNQPPIDMRLGRAQE